MRKTKSGKKNSPKGHPLKDTEVKKVSGGLALKPWTFKEDA